MSDYDPTNADPPSKSWLGPNPRYVLIPAAIVAMSGFFFFLSWLAH